MKFTKIVSVKIEGLAEALKNTAWYDANTNKAIASAVQNGTKEVTRRARRRAPRGETGKLKKSFKSEFDERSVIGYAKATARHAHLIEFGAKGAKVKPKNKKALKVDAYGLRRFYAHATIPDRKPNPFMVPAYEEVKPEIEAKIAAILREVKK